MSDKDSKLKTQDSKRILSDEGHKPREFTIYINNTYTGTLRPETFVNGTQDIKELDLEIPVIEKSAYDGIRASESELLGRLRALEAKANKLAEALERNIECAKMGHDVPNKYLFAIATDLERALAEYRGENK